MNIKNLYTPNFTQSKKTSFNANKTDDNLPKEDVKFISDNIKQQKKDMKSVVNNSVIFSVIGGIAGKIFSRKHLYYCDRDIQKFAQDFKFTSSGFLAGGILAAGATLWSIVNREEPKKINEEPK